MSTMAFAGLVKDVAAVRAHAKELSGVRKNDFVESRKRLSVAKERIFLAETPVGPMIMVYLDAPNAGFSLAQRMASSNAFDKYEIEAIGKMSGMDPTKRPAGPPPHLTFEWTNGKRGKGSMMIAAPVPDVSKLWTFCREMSARYQEHSESRERFGITLERAFYLHDAKMVVVYLEGDDPAAAMEASMKSTAAYDKWFNDQLALVHGIDFRASKPPTPELLVSYDG
jgi:hypothetical protein